MISNQRYLRAFARYTFFVVGKLISETSTNMDREELEAFVLELDTQDRKPDSQDWQSITKLVSLEFIIRTPELPWNAIDISYHPDLTLEFVRRHPEIQWSIVGILINRSIPTDELVNEYIDSYPISVVKYIVCNPKISISTINRLRDSFGTPEWTTLLSMAPEPAKILKLAGSYKHTFINPNITDQDMIDHIPELRDNNLEISARSVSPEMIISNPDLRWVYISKRRDDSHTAVQIARKLPQLGETIYYIYLNIRILDMILHFPTLYPLRVSNNHNCRRLTHITMEQALLHIDFRVWRQPLFNEPRDMDTLYPELMYDHEAFIAGMQLQKYREYNRRSCRNINVRIQFFGQN